MKKQIWNILFAAALLTTAACHNTGTSNTDDSAKAVQENPGENANPSDTALKVSGPTEADTVFTSEAAIGGLMEVQLGKLAQSKATAPKVIELAKMMVADHTKANEELQLTASTKKIKLPTSLDDKHQKDFDDFSKMEKQDFDKAYTAYMVKDHKEDIDKFKTEAEKGTDIEVKAFAAKHVPILQHHLQMAEAAKKVADGNK